MKNWIKAFRLRTLPLAVSCIILGGSLAAFQQLGILILLALTATALQICSNLANDYGDYVKGSDKNRKGEERMVSSGKISAASMKKAMFIAASIGLILGSLAVVLSPASTTIKLSIFGLGLLAIWAAIAYTVGKIPYGYRGLGDLFVLLFFGLVPVLSTALLCGAAFDYAMLLPAAGMGLLAASVLNVNNLRDYKQDKANKKKTLVVRLGEDQARTYHAVIIGVAFFFSAIYHFHAASHHLMSYLPFLSLILLLPSAKKVMQSRDEKVLDGQLKFHALGASLYGILLALSIYYA